MAANPTGSETITSAQLSPYRLRLNHPWETARGTWGHRQGWLIRLETGDGRAGYGDCAPWADLGTESAPRAEKGLKQALLGSIGVTPAAVMGTLDNWTDLPAVRCGMETVLLDLAAQRSGVPVARLLNPNAAKEVAVNAVLGPLDEDVGERVRRAIMQGFKVLKVKLGRKPVSEELDALVGLCGRLPDGINIRMDANGAWDERRAGEVIRAVRGLPVESLEEPLQEPEPEALGRLQELAEFPLALDESISRSLLDVPPVQRLVLKPMLLGGLWPAMRLARRVAGFGISCVATTTVDSAAGVCAAAHLAGALANGNAHGLATGEWIRDDDLGEGICVSNARLFLGDTAGLGFRPSEGLEFHDIRVSD